MRPISELGELSRLRRVVIVMASLTAVIAATGLIETHVFQVPTTLKYGMTIAAPMLLLVCALVERPLHVVTAVLIVVAPLSNATATLGTFKISFLVPLLALAFLFYAVSEPIVPSRPAMLWPAVLFFPLMLAPLIDGGDNHVLIVNAMLLIAIGTLVARVVRERGGLSTVYFAIAVQVAFQGVVAIYEVKTHHILNLYSAAGGTQYAANSSYVFGNSVRPIGTLNDPIGLANALVISVPILTALTIALDDLKIRISLIATIALVGVALGYALDRASWIGAAAGLLTTVVLLPTAVRRRAMPWLLLGVAIGVGALVAVEGSAITQKFASIFQPTKVTGVSADAAGEAYGEQDRLQFWSIAFNLGFLDHPLAGIGLDEMQKLITAHSTTNGLGVRQGTTAFTNAASTYLQMLGDAGSLAIALFLSLFYALWRDLKAGLSRHPILVAGLAGGVVAMLVCWVTDVVIMTEEPVAACIAVLFGCVAGVGQRTEDNDAETVATV